jgi:HPt (histidine-containing phosphotransfer) domain-containing protein
MTASTPIELSRLRSFSGGDPALEHELCTLYLATADRYLEAMASALRGQADWSSTAHALKGASANLGAVEVARLAAAAEHKLPSADTLDAIAGSLALVRDFIERRLRA